MACSGPLWLPGDCAPYGTSPPGGCRAEVHLAHPLGGQGLELPQVPRIAHFLITPGPPTDRRAVPVQDELAPLLMSVRFPVCLEDGLHLLSPENVGFFESVTKPSGFVVETLPWFLEGYSQGWGIVDLNVHGSVRLREKRLVSRKDLGVESNPRETSRPCIIPQDFPGTRSWNSARWCTRLRPDLAIRNGRHRSGCSIRLW